MSKRTTVPTLLERLDLPDEVSTQQAAQILGVDKKTVLRYYDAGQLPRRNIAPAMSSRAEYRYPLEAVLKLRTQYSCSEPTEKTSRRAGRTLPSAKYESRHIQLRDDE